MVDFVYWTNKPKTINKLRTKMSHLKGMCRFNSKWTTCDQYKNWLRPFKADSKKALCILCDKLVDLSNMGESALKSHTKSTKHIRNLDRLKTNTGNVMTTFFQPI